MSKRGPLARLYDALRLRAKRAFSFLNVRSGEAGMARLQGPFGYGGYGIQPISKTEQVLHFRGWTRTCVNYIASRISERAPVAALVSDPEEIESYKMARKAWQSGRGERPLARKFASKRWVQKAHGPARAEEEYEFLPASHDLCRLLARPNESDCDTGVSFWYEVIMFECLTGESYIWVVRDDAGRISEMYVIPSNWMRPVCLGKERMVDYFECMPRGGSAEGMVRFDPEEIIWYKWPSPLSKLYASSQLQAMAGDVDAYEKTQTARNVGLDNGTHTCGVIKLAAGMADPDEPTIERIESRWAAKYGGVFNINRPPILGPGMDWIPAPSEQELAFLQSSDQLKKYVIAQWGLDEAVIGFSSETTWAAVVATVRKTDRTAINTRKRALAEVMTEKLAKDFDERARIFWPEDDPIDPAEKRADYVAATTANAVSPNDWRTHVLDLEPYEEEIYDRPLVQAGLMNPSADGGMAGGEWDMEVGATGDTAPINPAQVKEDKSAPRFSVNGHKE